MPTIQFFESKRTERGIVGIDVRRYEGYHYPTGIERIKGDTSTLTFPKTDTVILYNLLEHVEDPCNLLRKSVEICQKNVFVNVPKRNEALWGNRVIECHQLDKTHQHCGFSKEEVNNIVRLSGGEDPKLQRNVRDQCAVAWSFVEQSNTERRRPCSFKTLLIENLLP